ncbi:Aste57867_24956 [Aphanomyces stellatus]|uniref:Aste57867_24956 protein n=1 Tax=Aphanomyces stellatus TaxID=120398 RepID=A0A485LW24_9STRA|nr:hypothetical protein As57867_024878 [Aphanomyces stellatus]VFU01587.1 Aste57867_24956 [Aphanomyces stellatus]
MTSTLSACGACGGRNIPEVPSYSGANLCVVEGCPNIQVRNLHCMRHVRTAELHPTKSLPLRICFNCKKDAIALDRLTIPLHCFAVADNDVLYRILTAVPVPAPVVKGPAAPSAVALRKMPPNRKRPAKYRGQRAKKPTLYHPFGPNPQRSANADEISLLSSDSEKEGDGKDSRQDKTTAVRALFQAMPPSSATQLPINVSPPTRCKTPSCELPATATGFCTRHVPLPMGPRCKYAGCTLGAVADGFCGAHNTVSPAAPLPALCQASLCTAIATSDGLCDTHAKDADNNLCKDPKCNIVAKLQGFCRGHYLLHRCRFPGCPAIASTDGYCTGHAVSAVPVAAVVSTPPVAGDVPAVVAPPLVATPVAVLTPATLLCQEDECKIGAKFQGFCRRHFLDRKCNRMGCSSLAQTGTGFCSTHVPASASTSFAVVVDPKLKCQDETCALAAKDQGFCTRHLLERMCVERGCKVLATHDRHCAAHVPPPPLAASPPKAPAPAPAPPRCKEDGCIVPAKTHGYCRRHYTSHQCSITDCGDVAEAGTSFCVAHVQLKLDPTSAADASASARCHAPACAKEAKLLGVCRRHYVELKCRTDACSLLSAAGSDYCDEHKPTIVVVDETEKVQCQAPGCALTETERGFCRRHGLERFCCHADCTSMATASGYCTVHATTKDEAVVAKVEAAAAPSLATCKEDACEEAPAIQGQGFCSRHYFTHKCRQQACSALSSDKSEFCLAHVPATNAAAAAAPRCQVDGCDIVAKVRGHCNHHFKEFKCKHFGCSEAKTTVEFCSAHAALSTTVPAAAPKVVVALCNVPNCLVVAKVDGRCQHHAAERQCRQPGCEAVAEKDGRCSKHATDADVAPVVDVLCKQDECRLRATKDGYCRLHFIESKAKAAKAAAPSFTNLCKFKNCFVLARTDGYCATHLKLSLQCKRVNCTLDAIPPADFCSTHAVGTATGSDKDEAKCQHPNCTLLAKTNGFCRKHYNESLRSTPPTATTAAAAAAPTAVAAPAPTRVFPPKDPSLCKFPECNTGAKSNGYCRRHFSTLAPPSLAQASAPTPVENAFEAFRCKQENCVLAVVRNGSCEDHEPKACLVKDCTVLAKAQGYCMKHSAAAATPAALASDDVPLAKSTALCKSDGCSVPAKMQGYCRLHFTANSATATASSATARAPTQVPCSIEGCIVVAKVQGFCRKHFYEHMHATLKPAESVAGPAVGPSSNTATSPVLCHVDGCRLRAVGQGQHCRLHLGEVATPPAVTLPPTTTCQHTDCTLPAATAGFCRKHFMEVKKESGTKDPSLCRFSGCNTVAKLKGFCRRHGNAITAADQPLATNEAEPIDLSMDSPAPPAAAADTCTVSGCKVKASASGLCAKHQQATAKTCQAEGCSFFAKRQGFCMRHLNKFK